MSWGEEQQKEIETIRERKITVKLSDADCDRLARKCGECQLQSELQEERSFTERLTDGIGRMLDFLEEHLPERLRPLLEKARELLPDPEIGQQQEQQQHQRGMGGMEL